jgi:hypothetical protein
MEQESTKRDLGLVVILAVLLAAGSLAHNFWFDRTLTRAHASALAVQRQLGSIEVALSDLRAAETGYLAAGQSPDFWMRRATEISEGISSAVAASRETVVTDEARTHLDAVSTALTSLMAIDARARAQVQADQRLLAGDIVLTEGLEDAQRIATELSGARTAESLADTANTVQIGRLRFGLNALGALLLLAVVWLAGRRPAPQQTAASSAAQTAQMLRDLPPPVKATPVGAAAAVTRPIVTAPVAPPPAVNLPDAAELCVDLARVMDTRDIPTLLERAAGVLGAKGLIVWMADGGAASLRPSLTHGYPERVINRLETLEIAAENVTSLAFRSMRPQVMNGSTASSAGAVAVPLITAAGCTGVLSAETRESKPAAETIAVARILAAQFATLIAPGEAEAPRAVAEA